MVMPYSDDDLLNYAKQFQQEEPAKQAKAVPEEDELLKYAQSLQPSRTKGVLERAGNLIGISGDQPYDPNLTPEENQAAWQMSIAKYPTVAGGLKSWGARAISGAYRVGEILPENWGGKYAQEQADWFSNYGTALQRAAEIAGDQGIVKKGLTGALSSAPTAVVAAPLGGPAMIGAAMLDTANQAVTEGRNAGLKGAELGAYTARQGMAEGAISGLLLKFGLGGIEKTLPGAWTAAKQGIRQGVASSWGQIAKQTGKAVGRTYGEELLDEVPTNVLQMLNDKYSGIDKSKLTIGQVYEDAKLTAAVTAWTVLGGTGPVHLAQNMKLQKTAKVFNEIVTAADEGKIPSRKQWKEWGFDPKQGDTQEQRAQGLQEAAQAIREQESVVEPEQAPTPQAGVQETTEGMPYVQEIAGQLSTEPELAQAHPEVVAESLQEAIQPPTPGEMVLSGIKNDLVNEARANRGEAELTQPAVKKWEESLDEAVREIAKSPLMPVELVEELNKSPRPVTDVESAALNLHYKGLKDSLGLAYQQRDAAIQSNDQGAMSRTQKQADIMLEQVRQVEEATKKAGTETARSLASRGILLKEDYSIGNMLSRASIAKGNKSLSADESGKVRELNLRIEQLQKQLETQANYAAEDKQNAAIEAQIESAKPRKSFRKSPEKVAAAKKEVKDAIANFKQVLAGKPVESFLTEEKGALDLEVVAAGYQVAKAYANLGYTTFTEFFYGPAKSILGTQADALKSHLYEAWQQLKTGGEVRPLAISRDDLNSIVRESRKLLRSLVKAGVVDRNTIINQVQTEFQEVIPDITRSEVMEALSGYGQFRKLSRSEIADKIRDLRGQIRQLAKLEAIEAGLPTKPTGFEQRQLSEAEQALIQKISSKKLKEQQL